MILAGRMDVTRKVASGALIERLPICCFDHFMRQVLKIVKHFGLVSKNFENSPYYLAYLT